MRMCTHTHTHKEPKQLFQSCWGRWLYCYPSMDANLNETQPLLLKHTLTPFLMVDCNTSPFALKLYSEQVYIYTCSSSTSVLCYCARLSIHLSTILFKSTQTQSSDDIILISQCLYILFQQHIEGGKKWEKNAQQIDNISVTAGAANIWLMLTVE